MSRRRRDMCHSAPTALKPSFLFLVRFVFALVLNSICTVTLFHTLRAILSLVVALPMEHALFVWFTTIGRWVCVIHIDPGFKSSNLLLEILYHRCVALLGQIRSNAILGIKRVLAPHNLPRLFFF